MIILVNRHGQLANRLWSYVSTISESLDTGENITILCFDEYVQNFDNLNKFDNIKFFAPFKNQGRKKYLKVLYKLYVYFLAGSAKYLHLYGSYFDGKLIIRHGWETRNNSINLSNIAKIKDIFCINSIYSKVIDQYMLPFKSKCKTIVSVHIRRGDYKHYKGGKYYFEDSHFYHYMIQFKNFFPEKQIQYVICSNENIDLDNFPNLDVIQFKKTNAIQDLYTIMSSDYIMGVPSTFSRWSSFINRIPCYLMEERGANLRLDDFKVINRLDYYEDGSSVFND